MKEISINLELDSIDEIKAKLFPLIKDYQHFVPVLTAGTYVYRASSYKSLKHFRISDISYRKPSEVGEQRANRKGHPVFYTSLQKNSPFFEVRPEIGSCLVISKWKLNHAPKINKIGYRPESLKKIGRISELKNWQIITAPREPVEISDFFANTYLISTEQVPNIYKLSISITELFLKDGLDGLIYPSVAANGNFDNIVFNTDFTDEHIKFVDAEYVKITDIENDDNNLQINYSLLDVAEGIDQHGFLNWKKDNCILSSVNSNQIMKKYRDIDGNVKVIFEDC